MLLCNKLNERVIYTTNPKYCVHIQLYYDITTLSLLPNMVDKQQHKHTPDITILCRVKARRAANPLVPIDHVDGVVHSGREVPYR